MFTNRIMIDYRALFKSFPGACLLLAPDPPVFTILGVNDAYLAATQTTDAIVSRPLFEVFPDNPSDPSATGVKNLTASLLFVIEHQQEHEMPIQRYDTPRPGSQAFNVRYWKPLNVPVRDDKGALVFILHTVEDVTDLMLLRRDLKNQDQLNQRQIRDAVLTTQELERVEISRELHDNICQILYTARLFLEKAKDGGGDFLDRGHELVLKAFDEVKALSGALLRSTHEEKKLNDSLEDLLGYIVALRQFNVTKTFELPDESLIESKVKTTIIRILQEQLANVIRHADARNVDITIHFRNNQLELSVRDDGKGFDMNEMHPGSGFQNMKTRAAVLDGHVMITSFPGDGCHIRVSLPIGPVKAGSGPPGSD
jgi:signal transduction histidine kinase